MTSPKCRLFLLAPREGEPSRLAACLEAALAAADAASLLISARREAAATRAVVEMLMPIAHAHDLAVLLEDAAMAAASDADGCQVAAQAVAEARRRVGRQRIVGALVGPSRHTAMEAAEAGADYIAFSAPDDVDACLDMIAWWSELFEIPAVAYDPAEPSRAGFVAAAGADFLRPCDRMWQDAAAARDVAAATSAAIAEARR